MNESGRAVRQIVDYYDLDPDDVIIVCDDMDLDCGRLRLRQKGFSWWGITGSRV